MKKALNTFIKRNPFYGEIPLFKEINTYLSLKYKCAFIEETHMQLVDFHSQNANTTKTRELSDLWIIAYSPKIKKAKMTFLQAKYEKYTKKSHIPFSFKGDFYQFELLSLRPLIINKNKFNFPKDILSSAISDSVGSFGVFYYDSNNNIDFAFSTASDLSLKTPATSKTKTKTFYFKGNSYNTTNILITKHLDIEIRSTLNADCFEYGLLNLLIGTPIEHDVNLLKYLKSYFQNLDFEYKDDFIDFISSARPNLKDINNEIYEVKNSNILILNVDEQNK